MTAGDVTKAILGLPRWKRHALYRRLGVLPVDWQEATDEEVDLDAARSMRASGLTVDRIAEAIAAIEATTP